MRACLDDSEVESEIQKLEVVSALERFKDPDLIERRADHSGGAAPGISGRISETYHICGYAGQNVQLVCRAGERAGKTPGKTSVFY